MFELYNDSILVTSCITLNQAIDAFQELVDSGDSLSDPGIWKGETRYAELDADGEIYVMGR